MLQIVPTLYRKMKLEKFPRAPKITKVSDSAVRRAAKRAGLIFASMVVAIPGSIDNYGAYMLIEPLSNTILGGYALGNSP